jgi:hypothetical protein
VNIACGFYFHMGQIGASHLMILLLDQSKFMCHTNIKLVVPNSCDLRVITPLGPGIDDCHEFQEERPPKDQLYPMSKLATSNVSISRCLFYPVLQDTSKLMRSMGVDACPGMTL